MPTGSTLVGAQKSLQFGRRRASKQLRAIPSNSELLRVGGAQELRATPSNSEPLQATQSYSEWGPRTPSHSELLRATPSYSDLLRVAPKNSELLPGSVPHCSIHLISPRSYSELGRPRTPSYSEDCELHRTLSGNCPRGQPDRF